MFARFSQPPPPSPCEPVGPESTYQGLRWEGESGVLTQADFAQRYQPLGVTAQQGQSLPNNSCFFFTFFGPSLCSLSGVKGRFPHPMYNTQRELLGLL